MIKSPKYYRWTQGRGELDREIYQIFARDGEFQKSLQGSKLESIRTLFPNLTDDATYPENSYRRKNSPLSYEKADQVYWFNVPGDQEQIAEAERWGWSVLVVDDYVQGFYLVKG